MNSTAKSKSRNRPIAGYTLVEILIGSSVSLLVVGASLWLMFEGVRSSTRSTNNSVNDLTQWGIASRLWIDSRIANGITIYEDNEETNLKRWERAVVGDRGNFIVFSLSDTDASNKTFYTKISGYYYSAGTQKVYRLDYDVTSADQNSNQTLEQILVNRRDDIIKTYDLIASDIDEVNTDGVFLCRTAGTAASFNGIVSQGDEANKTIREKTIEATFYVRS